MGRLCLEPWECTVCSRKLQVYPLMHGEICPRCRAPVHRHCIAGVLCLDCVLREEAQANLSA